MLLKEKKKKKRIMVPDIPKDSRVYPFSISNDFAMPANLESILNINGFEYHEYKGSFIIPPQSFPARGFSKRYVPWQALLFNNDEIIHVKDSLDLDESGTAVKVCADNLGYLKLNHCLLYGKLDIVCSNGKGANHIEVEYNTTGYYIAEPDLESFLKAGLGENKSSVAAEYVNERLKKIPTKYQNGVYIFILQKNEELLDFVFLPKMVHKFGLIKINLTPNVLLAVTGRMLVIIEDDFSVTSVYTWILTYIPMNNVRGISFEKMKRFTKVALTIKRGNLLEELSFGMDEKYTDDVKRLLADFIK